MASAWSPPPARPRPLRVLVVDDSPDLRLSTCALLGLWGHDAREAPDGPAALEAADAFRPEVVLLDLRLPGMDGFAVARQLLRLPHLARPRLVAVTGYGQEDDVARARAAGFDLLLVKPVEPEELRLQLRPPADAAVP
jgi:CheY-like chemotaxis protein